MKRYDWPNITILTCLLLLGLHEFGTCYGGRSWSLGGMAIRMAYALQLHKDLDHDPLDTKSKAQLSFIDREIRRRTMWACFLMDRFNSSGTGRPMFTREETIKVQLPIAEKYFQLDIEGPTEDLQGRVHRPVSPALGQLSDAKANMGVAAYMIRSIALWGRIIIYLFQGGRELEGYNIWDSEAKFTDLEKQADEFSSSLPDSLKYTLDNLTTHGTEGISNQFLFLHISAQQNILFLNHFAVYGHRGGRLPKDSPTDFVTKTTTKAVEAAKRISQLLRDAESYSVTAPFAGYCAFLSSTVQVTAAFSKDNATAVTAKMNLATNVRYLSMMKRYWGTFHWTLERLKEQFRSCADAARQGLADGTDQTPTSVYQYGDWFDRYPHGVSQSDFEDPAAVVKREKGGDAALEQKSDYRTVEEFFSALSPGNPEEHEAARSAKRRDMKKNQSAPPPQLKARRPSGTNVLPGPSLQVPNIHSQQIAQAYNQISPSNNINMYGQPLYYNQDLLLPPNPQGILPQLDRQLVFGTYAEIDQTSLGTLNTPENMVWGMNMDGATDFPVEPISAWFMPYNIEPPEASQDMDIFGHLGTTGIGYDVGGILVNQDNGMSRINGS
jgi:Fungal specific transcription factor domain